MNTTTDAADVWGWFLITVAIVAIVIIGATATLQSHRRTQARRTAAAAEVAVEVSAYGPCNAHRPHQYRLTADGTAHVCVRCQERVERGTPRRDDLPYDQELDLRGEDWRAWGDELRRRSA